MPKRNKRVISLDTETTGLDLHHIAKPFLVTSTSDEGTLFWEWFVNPKNRQPIIPESEKQEVVELIESADEIIFQNSKYDVQAFYTIGIEWKPEWWDKVQDCIYADHLLNSSELHSLDNQAIRYINVDIARYENRMEEACKEARNIAKREFPHWMIAKAGIPGMPSIKDGSTKKAEEKPWKNDTWLPRLIAREKNYPQGILDRVNIKKTRDFHQYIGRPKNTNGEWRFGNPFVIGQDGNREEVIEKHWLWLKTGKTFGNKDATQERRFWIQNNIKLLDGKVIGCFCEKEEKCHGDNYYKLLPKHDWWTLTSDYANVDSEGTLEIWKIQKKLIQDRGLWPVYEMRRKLFRIIAEIEINGMTYNNKRLEELEKEFTEESASKNKVCVQLSGGRVTELPDAGTTKDMQTLLFEDWKIPVLERSQKTGKPTVDRDVLEQYEATLPRGSKALAFIKALRIKRKRDKSLSDIKTYKKFGCKTKDKDTKVLHAFLNPADLVTLRLSASNPNNQAVSKQHFAGARSVRYLFGPAPGREWWSLDYTNIELRIPAYEAPEPDMIQLFERPNDPPFYGSNHLVTFSVLHPKQWAEHGVKCKDIYKDTLYQWVKSGNFAIACGAMPKEDGWGTADKAFHVKGGHSKLLSRFVNMAMLKERIIDHAEIHGYVNTMVDKEINCAYPIQIKRNKWGRISPTLPFSYHVQSTAMWAMYKAMIRVADFFRSWNLKHGFVNNRWEAVPKKKLGAFITMQVHDELVLDLPAKQGGQIETVMEVKSLMERSGDDIGVPLGVDFTYHPENWDEKGKHGS